MFLPKETIYLGTPETLFRCQSTRSSVPGLYRLWLNIQPLSSFLWLRPARLISPWLKPGVLRRGLIKRRHNGHIHTYTKFGSLIPATQASDGFCVGLLSNAEMMLSTHGELYSAP